MYAVIQTGGKQYRVRPGDLIVVDRLSGEVGDEIGFDKVLMIGEGAAVAVGAPLVAGAKVSATLVETRRGAKIKVFKKIRRQGYRRTRGHRQWESVLRVTALSDGKKSEAWEGEVDLTPLSVLHERARNLARNLEARRARLAQQREASPAEAEKAPTRKATAGKAGARKAPVKTTMKESAEPAGAREIEAGGPAAESLAKPTPAAEPKAPAAKASPKGPAAKASAKPAAKKPKAAETPAAKKPAAKKTSAAKASRGPKEK